MPAWLAVGLGNPGSRYEGSRHNAGRRSVEGLAGRLGSKMGSSKAPARVAETSSDGVRLILAAPTTYMNESGRAVASLTAYYRIDPEFLIVVHDEIDLPAGVLRVKRGGGSAGHHGIESVTNALKTRDFYRVRIGVGRPSSPLQDPTGFLLQQVSKQEASELAKAEERAGEAVLSLIHSGLDATRNRFNAAPE
ncbi:MAG: aminoacyl-tRNA hydrolase [Actinomycetota bacterium]|nr:aminoacyl-tRNA hydrolase [Actinomycetota bacterium]